MRAKICHFFACLNQAAKAKRSVFRIREFKQAAAILRPMVKEGYVKWYQKKDGMIEVTLRQTNKGPLVRQVFQQSKPSIKKYVHHKTVKENRRLGLTLNGSKVYTTKELKDKKLGGIYLAEIR
uniref:30S ribosomal protein S8 n=1 Tax=Lotharella oceanica TaxID=641309 RepID=A0A7S2TU75_9EUKA|mmetsp:Transcript_29720/g.55587  ORF Transcript_29720/g.55587 Transcript_29720/m.55587 type:complete len:123 (+) Transcript_29720:63-431(+)|eukprot:CAMPEP_0170178234 /NCGR_PEP_ID=MMETSP0040_2-20121228/11754_1 /TAXON_ID=641309 /ORGANISM="Lotharella oceanica, Strain CCMP622" /LENGTH=122 /DNA_ID=CAMNT_0010421239 /DNA_START=63 /DNA_END=431 /DNA_ORIENTATION=+